MKTPTFLLSLLLFFTSATVIAQIDTTPATTNENLDEYVGYYLPPYSTGLAPMEISRKGNKLYFSFKGSKVQTELTFVSQMNYCAANQPKNRLAFEKCTGWDVTHLFLYSGSTEVIFIKQKPPREPIAKMPASCKTITVAACINNEANLHIKNDSLFWQVIEGLPPGTHNQCGIGVTVNGQDWKNWKVPFAIGFKSAGLTVQPFVLQSNDYAELIQAPNAANGWETILHFLDLHKITHPHSYAVVIYFCPAGTIREPVTQAKTKNPNSSIRIVVDTARYKRINLDLAAHQVFFEPGEKELTPAATLQLKNIYDSLTTNKKTVEIIGHERRGSDNNQDWKLYYERSLAVSIYLINLGLDQTRIRFLGYGQDNQAIEEDLRKRVKLRIQERP